MSIHVAITRKIQPGKEIEFQDALRKFMGESFGYDTVHGAGIISFPGTNPREIGILRTFASKEEKEAFYHSDLFKAWEDYASTLTVGEAEYRELTGLEAWFRSTGAPPPRWKMAVVTLVGVYPVSMALHYTIGGVLSPLPVWLKSLVFAGCMVGLLTWVVMPTLVKAMKPWLHRAKNEKKSG